MSRAPAFFNSVAQVGEEDGTKLDFYGQKTAALLSNSCSAVCSSSPSSPPPHHTLIHHLRTAPSGTGGGGVRVMKYVWFVGLWYRAQMGANAAPVFAPRLWSCPHLLVLVGPGSGSDLTTRVDHQRKPAAGSSSDTGSYLPRKQSCCVCSSTCYMLRKRHILLMK